MNVLEVFLAKLFDSFKAKNPMLAAIIVALLLGFKYVLDNTTLFQGSYENIIEWVVLVIAALQGSRTTNVLKK